ncbi:plasminogen-binding N-terminal domain-containing protein [Nitrosophilus kaiyonis]|uniref:plasminogen-binding N-terminal domain-containing protein n=1 Tax=Nitrosophilus kaiyonis TaxID=2930200 RepID=UPI00248FD2DA|nr:plasminogen-binding N-terminal domain-containing protein [Nitrosophilus kaiyonis]
MKKIALFLAIFAISIFADITPNKTTTIIKSYSNGATIKNLDAPIGSSGVVVHYFDKIHSTIVARAELIENDKIAYRVFDALKQKALPTPKILPKNGDKVILNYLYDRALIIAPNFKTYENIKNSHPDIEWLHPDLFAAQLSISKNPAPNREDFKNFCNKYSVGLIYFAIKNRGYYVDCYSFKKVGYENISAQKGEIKLPFYSRIKEIQSSWFNFYGASEVRDYTNYYTNLLESK